MRLLSKKKLFLVGRWIDNKPWEVQGIYDSEKVASKKCIDDTYFIGPLNLNETLPAQTIEWSGAYYPKAKGSYLPPSRIKGVL